MSEEPNKKMDELLRAYAQERRKAPGVELHPANRRRLQREVTRQYGSAGGGEKPWWMWLRSFWPQIAFGSSLCVILGIAVLSLRQPQRTQGVLDKPAESTQKAAGPEIDLKQSEQKLEERGEPLLRGAEVNEARDFREDSLRESQRPAAPLSTPTTPLDTYGEALLGRKPALLETAPEATASPPNPTLRLADAPQQTEAEQVRLQSVETTLVKEKASFDSVKTDAAKAEEIATRQNKQGARTSSRALSTPNRTNPVSSAELLSRARDLTNLGAAKRLQFVQVATNANRGLAAAVVEPRTMPVLRTFQVEQLGQQVRFLDQDGSVYSGAMDPTNAPVILGFAAQGKDNFASPDQSYIYNFSVAGTNRTLGQDVVMTGQYFERTNTAPSSIELFSIAPNAVPPADLKNQARYLIIGNAVIGATNELPVRAVANGQ